MFVNFNILNQLGSPAINSNTFANRPAAGQTGRLFVSTDTYEIYRDNGTTWDLIGGPGSSTITGSGTATQVAYFTSSQAIGSSANLFWDNTSGFLGVATATPTARIEAVKTDGVGIYANFTTNAGSGSSTTALWAKNVTNSSGFAAVIEETTPNTTAGQYPLLIKHSLSSGTAGVGMGTGLHFQLPDDAGTFKTTQLTIETINAAAATYATRYRFNVQSNGSSTPVAYINATGVGIFTATPGAALDVHSTGTIAQFNTTSATGNTYIAFQRTGTGLWRIGDTYNGGANFFELHNTVLGVDAMEFEAATNKSAFQAQQTYTTGLARGNYFDYNLSVAAGGSFSSPNAITALGASLDLTLAGNATIPSGARSGLDAYNSIAFTGAGTLTHNQGTQIRAYSNLTAGWAFNGSAVGTITHLAGLRALFPDNSGSAVNVTNNYALLLNDQTANTGTVTYTNRWGVYQEGASDLNYMAANLLLGSTTNNGDRLQVTGAATITGNLSVDISTLYVDSVNNRVGVNTNSPDQTLTVNGITNIGAPGSSLGILIYPSLTGAIPSSGVKSTIANCNSGFGYAAGTLLFQPRIGVNASIVFATEGTEKAVLDYTGKFGIGTSAPASLLAVGGNPPTAGTISSVTTAAGISLALSDNTNSSLYVRNANGGSIIGTDPTGVIRFATNGNAAAQEVVRINANGNTLIGTTTDQGYKLQVNGSVYAAGNLDLRAATGTTWVDLLSAGAGSKNYRVTSQLIGVSNTGFGIRNVTDARNELEIDGSGNSKFYGSIQTAAPTTGTAAAWKLGSRVAATVVVNTTQYIEVDIGGTLYKLATVT